MSRRATLKSLESVLESFLERAVAMKEDRLQVLEGINRLDDIARSFKDGDNLTDSIGGWFADHNRWINGKVLRPAEQHRISGILSEIKRELEPASESSPAVRKIAREIDRWNTPRTPRPTTEPTPGTGSPRLILRRGPETTAIDQTDSISRFTGTLARLTDLFRDFSGNKKHLMSALDDALEYARLGPNKEALILSALIIYYLKQNGYKVEPFVKRLKEAERLLKGGR